MDPPTRRWSEWNFQRQPTESLRESIHVAGPVIPSHGEAN